MTDNTAGQAEPLWSRDRIADFLERTLGNEKITSATDAVRYARSAINAIVWDYKQALAAAQERIAQLESQVSFAAKLANARLEVAQWQEARIAELEAPQAERGEWEPVEDGEVSSFVYVDNGGKLLGVFAGDDYTDWYATEDLPDNIRLCRRVQRGDDNE